MDTILFSTNGHQRTIINRVLNLKCRMYSSFEAFLKDKHLEVSLVVIDDSTSFDRKILFEEIAFRDLKCPILIIHGNKDKRYHMISSNILYMPKPLNDSTLRRSLSLLNIKSNASEADEEKRDQHCANLVGSSKMMQDLRAELNIISKQNLPTIIFGETGVGKELAANHLHLNSSCRYKDMVKVNCSLLNSPISDSILFGHDKGSYTGADCMQEGLVQSANNTTFFLDEIENLNPASQAKLLRLVESGEYRRIGSQKILKSEFRLLTASNCTLDTLLNKKKFRSDFFYRISQFSVTMPPLREHKEDLDELVHHYYNKVGEMRDVDSSFMQTLYDHDFPGNVRELNAILERSRAFSRGSTISIRM
jgi:DNA-binding NtrC family response regulator